MAAAGYGALLEALRGVSWPARSIASGTLTGSHRARLRGMSSEFTEYRAYRQGDDPRRLDWRLLARSNRAYIRLSADQAQLRTMIIADASASMAFPAGSQDKWRVCRELAVGLAAVAHSDGDPVGCVVAVEGRYPRVDPRNRRGVVGEIARLLDSVRCSGAAALAPAVSAGRGGARMVVLTDLLGDLDALLAAARPHLAMGGEVHVAHIIAREEMDPPHHAVTAVDPEAPESRRPLVEATRAAYLEAFASWRADVAQRWRAAGASYTEVSTAAPTDRMVRAIASGVTA
jgi:uncharacterized protein (DUF58 family)